MPDAGSRRIVLDSSFLIAFHNAGDVHHDAARAAMSDLVEGRWGPALLPEYVFLEVTTVLAARKDLSTAVDVGETLLAAEEVRFAPCSDVFLDAFEVFRSQPDAGLSFADAAVVALARRYGATRVATFDRDFRGLDGIDVVPG